MVMKTKALVIQRDPGDEYAHVAITAEVPDSPPVVRVTAKQWLTVVNPDNGLSAVFGPGETLPQWALDELEAEKAEPPTSIAAVNGPSSEGAHPSHTLRGKRASIVEDTPRGRAQ